MRQLRIKSKRKWRRRTHTCVRTLLPFPPPPFHSLTHVLHTGFLPDGQGGLRGAVKGPSQHFADVSPPDVLDGRAEEPAGEELLKGVGALSGGGRKEGGREEG